jgi:hypothetical protein
MFQRARDSGDLRGTRRSDTGPDACKETLPDLHDAKTDLGAARARL